MRNPDRIERILAKIAKAWKLQPDTRLCQLLSNEARAVGWPDNDLFYLEDEVLESAFDQTLMCEECGKYPADLPSKLCPGCEAYQAHTR